MKPPDETTMLRDFPWVVVRMRCHFCRRGGDVRLAVFAEKYGAYATLGYLVIEFIKGCEWAPWNPSRRPQKYGMKCGGYCPDLRRPEAIHPKAMPVILTTLEECELWMTAPWDQAKALQRPLVDASLAIVARGTKKDEPGEEPLLATVET